MSWSRVPSKPKVSILIPVNKPVSPTWALGLAELLIYSFVLQGIPYSIRYHKGIFRIDITRANLIMEGLADLAGIKDEEIKNYSFSELVEKVNSEKGDKYLLFLDSDVIPPRNGLLWLIKHKLPVVSGIYREKNGKLNAHKRNPDGAYSNMTLEELAKNGGYADAIGLGFCLINAKVFKLLKNESPLFLWSWDPYWNPKGTGEDIYFCQLLKKVGIPIYVEIGCKCRHVINGRAWDIDKGLVEVA